MRDIVLDEHYEIVDELGEKNDEIKQALQEVLDAFLEERVKMSMAKRAEKLGYRFCKQLWGELIKYPPMSVADFIALDYDSLNDIWVHYMELTAYYNRYFEIADNKQLFCAYAGINTRQYSQLERHEDEDIRNLVKSMNDAFIGLGFVIGESGNADVKGVSQRLKASNDAGHSVMSATEERVVEQVGAISEAELNKRLERNGIILIDKA